MNNKMYLGKALAVCISAVNPPLWAQIVYPPEEPANIMAPVEPTEDHKTAAVLQKEHASHHKAMAEYHKSVAAEYGKAGHKSLKKHHEALAKHHEALAKEHEKTAATHESLAKPKK